MGLRACADRELTAPPAGYRRIRPPSPACGTSSCSKAPRPPRPTRPGTRSAAGDGASGIRTLRVQTRRRRSTRTRWPDSAEGVKERTHPVGHYSGGHQADSHQQGEFAVAGGDHTAADHVLVRTGADLSSSGWLARRRLWRATNGRLADRRAPRDAGRAAPSADARRGHQLSPTPGRRRPPSRWQTAEVCRLLSAPRPMPPSWAGSPSRSRRRSPTWPASRRASARSTSAPVPAR